MSRVQTQRPPSTSKVTPVMKSTHSARLLARHLGAFMGGDTLEHRANFRASVRLGRLSTGVILPMLPFISVQGSG